MPAVIPVYVKLLPPDASQCGQAVRSDLASTWIDVYSEVLHTRFVHSMAMYAALGSAAQSRCKPCMHGVRLAAKHMARETAGMSQRERERQSSAAFLCDLARELGRKLGLLEDRLWTELKALGRYEDKATEPEPEPAQVGLFDGDPVPA